ncbi:hypothetical protein D3C85_1113650 [compost metagenome]
MLIDGHVQIGAVIEQTLVQEVIHALDEGLLELQPPILVHAAFVHDREIKLQGQLG